MSRRKLIPATIRNTSAHQNTAEHPQKTTIDDVHSDPYKLTKDKIKEPQPGSRNSMKF